LKTFLREPDHSVDNMLTYSSVQNYVNVHL
jgi:hypothetical protein